MGFAKGVKKYAEKYLGKTGELKEKARAKSESLKGHIGYMKKETGGEVDSLKKEAQDLKRVFQSKEIILVKTDAIAVVLRKMGGLDEFVAAVDKLTKEGYRMVLREEVREIQIPVAVFKVPLGTFYYFQHAKYITQ